MNLLTKSQSQRSRLQACYRSFERVSRWRYHIYCFKYLSISIDELTQTFNERLQMNNDIENEFDSIITLPENNIPFDQSQNNFNYYSV